MSENKFFTQFIKKGIAKTILWITVSIAFMLTLLIGAIQFPYVQSKVVSELTDYLSQKSGFPFKVGAVRIRWFDTILLKDVKILDTEQKVMIEVNEIVIDFKIRSLLQNGNLNFDEANIYDANVNLYRNTYDGDYNINLFVYNLKQLFKSSKSSGNKKYTEFKIDEVNLNNAQFKLIDPTQDSIKDAFDYYHFEIVDINSKIRDFRLVADTLEIDVKQLKAIEPVTGLTVNQFQGFYRVSDQIMEFLNVDALINNSIIKDSIVFHYNSLSDLNNFNDKILIVASLNQTKLYSKDLGHFAPYLMDFDDYYTISGNFKGTVKKFGINNLDLNFGTSSSLYGRVSFEGLPDVRSTFMDLNFTKNSSISSPDLKGFVNDDDLEYIEKFGRITFSGHFLGFFNDFVTEGKFNTKLGYIESDLNLKIADEPTQSSYSGKLVTKEVHIGELFGLQNMLGKIDMNGHIKGKGFTSESAEMNLKAYIKKLNFIKYTYQNIETDAHLSKQLFKGNLSVNDPNLKLEVEAEIDFEDNKDLIKVDAEIGHSNLKELNLVRESLNLKSKVKTHLNGLDLDNITGEVFLENFSLTNQYSDLHMDFVEITAKAQEEDNKTYVVESDLFDFRSKGDFKITNLINDLATLWDEYELNLENNAEEIQDYYNNKKTGPEDYSFDFVFQLKNINPIFELFKNNLQVSKNIEVKGNFQSGYTSTFTLKTAIDSLIVDRNRFFDSEIDFSSSKISDSTSVMAMVYIKSGKQVFSEAMHTENFLLEAIWNRKFIDFKTRINDQNNGNKAEINGFVQFLPEQLLLSFRQADFTLIEKEWKISDHNKIIIDQGDISFEKFKLSYENQNVAFNGVISKDPDKNLNILINAFQLENLNPILSENLQGELNGFIELKNTPESYERDDKDLNFMVESHININDFMVNKFEIGDIEGFTEWEKEERKLKVDYILRRDQKKIIDVKGFYNPEEPENQLDLNAKFDHANLSIAEPFIDELFSNIEGTATGNFKITGALNYPILKGVGDIQHGKFKINYLNTSYTFDGLINFSENEIGVRNLSVLDDQKNKAVINGGFFHDGFQNFIINLKGDLENVKILNTTAKNNDLYYGTAFASGHFDILGSVKNLTISAYGISQKGTKIFIPMGGTSGVEQQQEFINFVSKKDSSSIKIESEIEKINLTGLKLNLDLELTPDAYCEIIFDIRTGDIIRGRGNGKMKMLIDTNGDFNMFGDYELQEGGYNFTLYNIINKEFKIQSGSKLSWYGDPYEGILDIKASYDQFAALSPILANVDSSLQRKPEFRRRYPTKVVLDLKGALMSPDIKYDILIDAPENIIELSTAVRAFKARLEVDEQELNRQVFSLLILKRFSQENAFSVGSQTVENSVSELVSNHLSYLLNQVDDNFEIDMDLNGLDADAWSTMQLRLSYSMLDGRLRITRDGTFTNMNNQADPNSILGDWTIEYLLTSDGKLRAKMYNRNNYTMVMMGEDGSNITRGVSLMHVESFDHLKELFKKKKEAPSAPEDKNDLKINAGPVIREEEIENRSKNETAEKTKNDMDF